MYFSWGDGHIKLATAEWMILGPRTWLIISRSVVQYLKTRLGTVLVLF
jgi:hypothetical protein